MQHARAKNIRYSKKTTDNSLSVQKPEGCLIKFPVKDNCISVLISYCGEIHICEIDIENFVANMWGARNLVSRINYQLREMNLISE